MTSIGTKAAGTAIVVTVLFALGGATAAVLSSATAAETGDRTVFCTDYVPAVQASSLYQKWASQNKGENQKWLDVRNAVCANQDPSLPVMATAFGKSLIAAARMAAGDPPLTTTATSSTPATTTSPTTTTAPGTTTTTVTTTPSGSCALYASTSGSDSNPGTQASPLRTVGALLGKISPGQTGCLMGGTFNETLTVSRGGSSGQRITLTTAPGYSAATIQAGSIYIKVDYVTLRNLRIVGTASNVTMQTFGNFVTYQNLDITNNHNGESCITVGEYEGSYAKNISGFVLDHSKIHDCGQLSNGEHDHGIYVAAADHPSVTNNWFWGNEGGWNMQLWTSSQNGYFANNVLDGGYVGNVIVAGANYLTGPSSNNVFEKDIFVYPRSGYQIESYWSGTKGTGNVVRDSCVWGSTSSGAFDTSDGGFTTGNITTADPGFVNRAGHDYNLQSVVPCGGYGSSGTVGVTS